jgi:cyclase
MRPAIRSLLMAGMLLRALAGGALAQSRPTIEVAKLKEGFYRLTSMVPYKANFLAFVSGDGILLVDAGQRQTGGELRSVLRSIAGSDAPVRILINTHAHIDHTGGNLALAGEPMIVGPEILRSTLRSYSYVLYEFPENALPSVTFSDSMNIHFGGETIRIIATPGSHDATDVIVHFTNAGIVCMGDISYGMTFPSVDGYTGNLLKYPEVIDRILTLIPDDVTIVSGHGRETSVDELRQFRDMIAATAKRVHEEMAKGKDVATMQREDILQEWSAFDGGVGGNRARWIAALANAGPGRFRGSVAGELYAVLVHGDADAAIARYRELKRDYPTEYPFADNHLVRVGYWLLDKGRTADAIKLLQLYVSEFPDSANGYDSLGEAYMRAGDTDAAIRNYEKSLELNPQNDNARAMLKRLRA